MIDVPHWEARVRNLDGDLRARPSLRGTSSSGASAIHLQVLRSDGLVFLLWVAQRARVKDQEAQLAERRRLAVEEVAVE